MSSGSGPSKQFTHRYLLSKTNTQGTYSIASAGYTGTYKATDAPDAGKTDNLTQLGDIQRDAFTGNNSVRDFNRAYIGDTSDKQSMVMVSVSARPTYFLYTNNSYAVGASVTAINEPFALCFASGTRILTARGAVPVEELAAGDQAVTASGAHRPVVWTGHRHVDGGGETLGADQSPVRVRADAFGPGRPARDLRLSPGHPVLVGADADGQGGVLVPVMCLVNGTSIAREPAASVTYWHVELDAHDILLAEGLPAESFLDFGCRAFFEEASDHALHNPDFVPPGLSGRCRPVVVEGPVVEAERARLDALFALGLTDQCGWSADGAFAQVA